MNLPVSSKPLLLGILSFFVFAATLTFEYFGLLQPAQQQHTQVQQELKTEQMLLTKSTQPSQDETNNETGVSDFVQHQLPVKPLVDEYMLDLEKAEGISGVTIRNITLQDATKTNNQGNSNNGTPSSPTNTTQTNATSAANGAVNQSATSTPGITSQNKNANVPVPITLNVEVQYSVYEELQSFLKQIEGMQRITYVQKIEFQGRDEIVAPNTKQSPYHCILMLTIYYMPSLKELEKGTPSIQLPPLCENRTNPVEPQQCR